MNLINVILFSALFLVSACSISNKNESKVQGKENSKVLVALDAANVESVGGGAGAPLTQVINRQVFYNHSSNPVFSDVNGNPVNSIDQTKKALFTAQSSGSENYTNYYKGINGIVVDFEGATGNLSRNDFEFATWNLITPWGFASLNTAITVSEIPGGGVNGSKRIKITFNDEAVKNTWLQVKILANSTTRLSKMDVFYFGNAVGDCYVGNKGTPQIITSDVSDYNAVLSNLTNSANISNVYDLNKDGLVNSADSLIVNKNLKAAIIKMFKPLTTDLCGVYAGDNSSCADCNGVPYGKAVIDECDVCGGNNASCGDCSGVAYGEAVVDECGVCGGDGSSCPDCNGILFGGAEMDECDVCGGDNSSCSDCNGIAYGGALSDECGVCGGDNSSCTDCAGTRFGTVTVDTCGICGGDGNSCIGNNTLDPKRNITNCTSHGGDPYPWEGSGACTGNYQVAIPVGATGQVLIQNSATPEGDFGFGTSGFRLAIDKRLYKSGSSLHTVRGDGSAVKYHSSGSSWVSDYQQLSRNTIQAVGANFQEKMRDGTKIIYAPIVSQSTTYGLVSIVQLNGRGVFLTRDNGGRIKSIKNNFNVGVTIDYDQTGHASVITDADGNAYGIIYDNERLSQIAYPDGFSTWQIEYATATNRVVFFKDTKSGYTKINYTSEGLLSDVTTPDGKKVKFIYASGQVQVRGFMSNVDETINGQGAVVTSFNENLPSNLTYDSLFQVLTSTDNFGSLTRYAYNGQELASITLPNGNVHSYTYENGNVVSSTVTGPLRSFTTKYTYDSVTNRLLTISGPGSYTRQYTYDLQGNLKEDKINGKVVLSTTYNSQGQLISKTVKGATTSYGYDSYGNQNLLASREGAINYVRKPSGLPVNISAPNYVESRSYDSVGRPTVITKSSPGSNKPAYISTTEYSLNSALTLDNIGNGLDQQSSGNGSYKERVLGDGFVNVPWGNGLDVNAPKYTNP